MKQRYNSLTPKQKRDRSRRCRERDPARMKTYTKRWRDKNPETDKERRRIYEAKRRAKKRETPGGFSTEDVKRLHSAQKGRCWWCQNKLNIWHIDHRVALSKGGTNDLANIVLACPPCNLKKQAKMPWETENPRLL